MEVGTFAKAEIHRPRWKVLNVHPFCFCSPARTRAAPCPGAAWKRVGELRVPLKLGWARVLVEHVLTRPTAGNGVFALCSKTMTHTGTSECAHGSVSGKCFICICMCFCKGCNHRVYKREKNSQQRQPTSKKGLLWVLKEDTDYVLAFHGEMNFTCRFLSSLQVSDPVFSL